MQYCSLQHQTLLPSPVTSVTGCCFCFVSVSSFFLDLFIQSPPVAYRAPTNLGSSSFSVLSFCFFIVFMGLMGGAVFPFYYLTSAQTMVENSDKMWSPGEVNGKQFQYSCFENPKNSMKRQKDRTLKDGCAICCWRSVEK